MGMSLFFAFSLWQSITLSASSRPELHLDAGSTSAAYAVFRLKHRAGETAAGKVSHEDRQALFETRKAEVEAHNSRKASWKMAVNHFSDYTHHELKSYLGYKRTDKWQPSSASSFLQTTPHGNNIDTSKLKANIDWTKTMNFSNFVHNQGSCGSCWAHAAVAALEAHAELTNGVQVKLATQEVIDCTANPRHCGGTGGCHGATSEQAFEFAREFGIPLLSAYKGGGAAACPQQMRPASQDMMLVQSFVRLPENRASHVMHTLAEVGPVVMSIDAAGLFGYGNGVYAGCQPDTIVNHAVLGVGYGRDQASGMDFWLIKNSWGEGWGEDGYFRIQRSSEDEWMCGTDNKPQEGVYCDEHPDTIPVCGMCGVTSDSTYPVMAIIQQALQQADSSRRRQSRLRAAQVKLVEVF